MLPSFVFDSRILANRRTLWHLATGNPSGGAAQRPRVLLLHGEYYLERMDATRILSEATSDGRLPSADYIFVSHIDHVIRRPETTCNPQFAKCVVDEIPAFLDRELGSRGTTPLIVGGLSLTGLAAAHAGWIGRGKVSGVLAQSGSFWWSKEWLTRQIAADPCPAVRFVLSCGLIETTAPTDHGNGLIQSLSQLDSCRRFHATLRKTGHTSTLIEHEGGHAIDAWGRVLVELLLPLMPFGSSA